MGVATIGVDEDFAAPTAVMLDVALPAVLSTGAAVDFSLFGLSFFDFFPSFLRCFALGRVLSSPSDELNKEEIPAESDDGDLGRRLPILVAGDKSEITRGVNRAKPSTINGSAATNGKYTVRYSQLYMMRTSFDTLFAVSLVQRLTLDLVNGRVSAHLFVGSWIVVFDCFRNRTEVHLRR